MDYLFKLIKDNISVIYFLYGLGFFTMGILILSQPKKDSAFKFAKALWLLAGFGIMHGLNEWIDVLEIIKGKNTTFDVLKNITLFISFLMLFEFGRRIFNFNLPHAAKISLKNRKRLMLLLNWHTLPLITIIILTASHFSANPLQMLEALSIYLLCFPGSLLTAIGLYGYYFCKNDADKPASLKPYFQAASLSFAFYSVFGGLIAPKTAIFPANWINETSFFETFHLPVQLFHAILAIVISYSMLVINRIFYIEKTINLEKTLDKVKQINETLNTEINRRIETEQKLIEKTTYLDTLLVSSKDTAIAATDLDFRIIYYNPTAEKLFGYSADEVIGKTVQEVHTKEKVDSVRFINAIETVMKEGVYKYSLKFERDGINRYFSSTVYGIWQDKTIKGFMLMSKDVTDEELYKEQMRRFMRSIEFAGESIVITSAEGLIRYVNPAFTETTGYTSNEALGRNPSILKSGKHSTEFYEDLWSTITHGSVWRGEITNKRKDGSLFYAKLTIAPIYGASGNIEEFVAVQSDITKDKLIEEELQSHRQHLEQLVRERTKELQTSNEKLINEINERIEAENALRASQELLNEAQRVGKLGVWEFDYSAKKLSWSDEVYRIFGFNPDNFTLNHENFLNCVRSDDIVNILTAFNEAIKNRQPYVIDYRIILPDKTERVVEEHGKFFFDEQGSPSKSLGIIIDITERKNNEKELEKYRNELETLVADRTLELEKLNNQLKMEIIERNRIEEALYANEETLLALMNAITETVFLIACDGKVLVINDTGARRLGKYPHEIIDTIIYDSMPEHIAKNKREMVNKVVRNARPLFFEDNVDGIYMANSVYPVFDEKSNISRVAVFTMDITKQKQAVNALKDSEEKFRYLADKSPNMIFINNKGTVVYVNDKCVEITGYTKEELYSADFNFMQLIAPESIELIKDKFRHHLEQEDVPPYEYSILTKYGKRIEAINTTKIIPYDGEKAVLGIITDITDRRQREEKLRLFSHAVEDAAMDAIQIVDLNRKITFANKATEEILGYTQQECLGTNPVESFGVDPDFVRNVIDPSIETTGKWIGEVVHKHKDGHELTVWLSASTVKNQEGKPIALLGIFRDITSRKKTEESLALRQKEIEELNKALEIRVDEEVKKSREKDLIMMHQSRQASMGEMIGHIAHQWRQPLNALQILLYNIKDSFEEKEQDEDTIETLFEQGSKIINKMSTTIDDFRNFFKPSKEKEVFNVNSTVKSSLSLIAATFKNHDITVETYENDNISTYGFINEYSQVILNILNNSKDAIVENKTRGLITLTIMRESDWAVVKIKDNGCGIPEDIVANVFDPYFTTKGEGKGTGIGLYMSKVIIEEHMSGKIKVQNNLPKGVEFIIITPIAYETVNCKEI
ncbi:PAS/PAC sensor signal transduction histidine kinase [Candidatus Magnetoovum chiemensis]|nr:PAS/PAC sensor signal transduction histidine kinase [Candidatus Magnetoovum chiemensis]